MTKKNIVLAISLLLVSGAPAQYKTKVSRKAQPPVSVYQQFMSSQKDLTLEEQRSAFIRYLMEQMTIEEKNRSTEPYRCWQYQYRYRTERC